MHCKYQYSQDVDVTFSGKENWGMGGMGGHPMMNGGGQVKTHYQDKGGDLDEDKKSVDEGRYWWRW